MTSDMRASPPPATHFLATTPLDAKDLIDGEISPDSLFDEPQEPPAAPSKSTPLGARTTAADNVDLIGAAISRRSAPPIPGLYFDPSLLLPTDLADSVLRACMTSFFADHTATGVNQVMLFGRAGRDSESSSAFPPFLSALLAATSELLLSHPMMPRETHAMLFPPSPSRAQEQQQQQQQEEHHVPRARQAIVNMYRPGEGIAPHVDLLNRFGDGIVGVSLGGGAAMRFARAESRETQMVEGDLGCGGDGHRDGGQHEVWLPPRSVLVLTGDARYEWTHGIAPRLRDKVEAEDASGESEWQWQERGVRVSVTFRWLLPGAEIVGGDFDSDSDSDDGLVHRADAGRQGGGNEKEV